MKARFTGDGRNRDTRAALPVRAASQVTQGETIAQIDPRDFESQIAQLPSQMDRAVAQLDALRSAAREEEIAALEAAMQSAEAQVAFRVAEANLRAQQEQLRIGQVGGRPEDIAATPGYPQLDAVFSKMRAKISGVYEYPRDPQRDLIIVEGVSKVVLSGVQVEVIYVEHAPARLTELGLAPAQIRELLEGQNLVTPAASITAGTARLSVWPEGAVGSIEAIESLLTTNTQTGTSFRLGDVATVSRGLKEPPSSPLFRNGEPAIGLGISKPLGGNVVTMGKAVQARIDVLEGERPIGINALPISDQGTSVEASVNDFVVTVAGTLFGMYIHGLDMQRISLGCDFSR